MCHARNVSRGRDEVDERRPNRKAVAPRNGMQDRTLLGNMGGVVRTWGEPGG